MGVSHITIHGRTRHQASTEPVNLPGLRFAVECAKGQVPTVANGDLWTLDDAAKMRTTGVNGVMAARGLLAKSVYPLISLGSSVTHRADGAVQPCLRGMTRHLFMPLNSFVIYR